MMERLERLLYRAFRVNPAIAMLELRTRLRGQRPFGMLFFFAFIGALTLVIAFLIIEYPRRYLTGGMSAPSQEGGTVLMALFLVQLSLVFLIMPAYGASTIAAEREKKTLELVQTSLLSATDIVSGKLISIMAFALILLIANLPVAVLCTMLGGVNLIQLAQGYSYLLVVTVALIALGLLMSSLSGRMITSVVATYGVVLFVFGGLPLLGVMILSMLTMATSRTVVFGVTGSTVLILILGVLVAVLAYMILRAIARRFKRLEGSLIGVASPAVIAVAAGGLVTLMSAGLISSSVSWHWEVLLVAHPYFAMIGIMQPEFAEEMIRSAGGSSPVDPGTLIWLADSALGLLMAALLWFLATSALRWRRI